MAEVTVDPGSSALRIQDIVKSDRPVVPMGGTRPLEVAPHKPPEILGLYVLVPSGGGRRCPRPQSTWKGVFPPRIFWTI